MAGKIKTKPASGEYRTLSGKIKLLRRQNDFLYPVEIWLLNDAVNRNNWRYERVAENKNKFLGTPILVAYINGGRTVGDGHNFRNEIDPKTGEPAPSFTDATAERIVGALSEDAADIRIEKENGVTWIVGRGTLWAWYAKELVEKIDRDAEQGREMSISIETLVTKNHIEGEIEVEEEYEILGTTILGDHVSPAVAGAHISALSVKDSDFRELKVRAASYVSEDHSTNEKGLTTLSIYSKKQLEALQAKFTGWRVLQAVQGDDGVIQVALCSDKYEFARYEMQDVNETIAPERIVSCATTADFGTGAPVDISPILDEISRLNTALEQANATVTERENQIAAMTEFENKRRVQAAKDTAKATLAAFNEAREDAEEIEECELDELNAEIECGTYTNSVDKDGAWIGDKAVEERVYAICARKVQAEARTAAAKNKRVSVYDKFRNENDNDAGDVASLLARKGIL